MKKRTILTVDDTITNLDILVELLDEYDVIDATNGKEALEIAREENIELILLDIMMPEMDGYEVCQKLKENEKTRDIPVIFITAKTDEESIAKAFKFGGVDYVTKPFKPQELLARVETHLKLRSLVCYLEDEVEEKTAKILEQKETIFQQRKKAAMGDMIGIIAHQLKQPLNAISVSGVMVHEKFENNTLTQKDMVTFEQRTFEQIRFMSRSIDELRNFFNPNKKPRSYNVKNTINKALSFIDTLVSSKGIELSVDIKDNINAVGFDNELQQVILNIVNNAKDILIEKKPEFPMIKVVGKEEGDKVAITIEDNGGGIPKDIIEKVFDSYFTTKGEKGTGIGLNLVRMIVEDSMSGKISVVNTNFGAVFKIVV